MARDCWSSCSFLGCVDGPSLLHAEQSVPEAGPALELLDMLGVPRVRLYRGLLEDLRNKLEGKSSSCYLPL